MQVDKMNEFVTEALTDIDSRYNFTNFFSIILIGKDIILIEFHKFREKVPTMGFEHKIFDIDCQCSPIKVHDLTTGLQICVIVFIMLDICYKRVKKIGHPPLYSFQLKSN